MGRTRGAIAAATLVLAAACGAADGSGEEPTDGTAAAVEPTAAADPAGTPTSAPPADGRSPDEAGTDEQRPTIVDGDPLPALTAAPGRQRAGIVVDGRARVYEAVVPDAALDGPVPLVLAFHGFGQQAGPFIEVAGLDEAAAEAGWLLLAPDGVERSFNAGGGDGGCCGPALDDDVDDVALVRALVDEVAAVLGHVPEAVVATGFSNGGMFSHRLGCEAADVVDGVVAASGALFVEDCAPSRPVEVRHVHGSSDLVVPQSRGVQAVDTWADLQGCETSTPLDGEVEGLQGTTWTGCEGDVQVSFLLRRRVGHDWLRGAPLDTNTVVGEVLERIRRRTDGS